MVGSPGQTTQTLIEDMEFLEKLQPEMVGIGPFIPHHDTPFKGEPQGGLELTLYLLSLIRLLLPRVLLPATTALGTIDPMGREMGVLQGPTWSCPICHRKMSGKNISCMTIRSIQERKRQNVWTLLGNL